MTTAQVVRFVVPDGIDDPTTPSGGNVYDRRLCQELVRSGWTVEELAVSGARDATVAGILGGVPDGAVALVDGLVALAAPGAVLAETDRLRVVVLLHMPFGERDPEVRGRERQLLSATSAVVTTSEWSRGWVLYHYGLRPWRVHVARPGTDHAAPRGGSESGGRLLCVAAVTRDKGHDVLIEALARVLDLPWRLTCAGSLSRERDVAEQRQRACAGLAGRVTWTGALSREELGKAYAEADALVLASRAESWGMVVTEALAHGLPVLATDVGGVREALGSSRAGRPGLLVPEGDVTALSMAVRHWLEDHELRAVLREAARERRTTRRGWAETAASVAPVLEEVAR
jgi:glycosyltransferase involved in cell wall biosynthesis